LSIAKSIANIIHNFNIRRAKLREDEENVNKEENTSFDWDSLYLSLKSLREKYAKLVEQILDNENIDSEQAYLFVPLLYNYQDPVYKDARFTAEGDENIELMETEEVKKGSGYRRRTRKKTRPRRTKRSTRTTRPRRMKRTTKTKRTRKRRKN
jgi:hypothetical protein